jgi:hypothetical protein
MNKKIVISIILFFLLINVIPLSNIVQASSYTVSYDFEHTPNLNQVSIADMGNGWLTSKNMSSPYFCVGDAVLGAPFSGSKMFYIKDTVAKRVSGYFNFSYSPSSYLTDFSFWYYGASINNLYMFFNDSLGNTIIMLQLLTASCKYFDYVAGSHTFYYNSGAIAYYNIGFEIVDNQSVNYYSKKSGNASFTSFLDKSPRTFMPSNGSRIVSCWVYAPVVNGYSKFDLFNITVSSSFSGGGGSNTSCNDFSDYGSLNHVTNPNGHYYATNPYLEIYGSSKINATLKGFELLLDYAQITSDSDLNNYYLYINNNYIGSATCYYVYDDASNIMLQWDMSSITLNLTDELPVFELLHYKPSESIQWYLKTYNYIYGPPALHDIFGSWATTHIDGIYQYDNINRYHSPRWILYYSIGTENDCDNVNTLSLIDGSGNLLPTHTTWNIPFVYVHRTMFIDITVTNLVGYSIHVYKGGVEYGNSQGFPHNIYSCSRTIGFTPYDVGNYTISLKYGTTYIENESLNVSYIDETFALWTSPNPSGYGATVTITVYAKNPARYSNYSIGLFSSIAETSTIENADTRYDISEFTNNYYSVVSGDFGTAGTLYLRLFGSNTTLFVPITGIYPHFVDFLIQSPYIYTSLRDNVAGINEHFTIYGYYASTIRSAKVFILGSSVDVSGTGAFTIEYNGFTKAGTYDIYLKELQNGVYITVAKCSVSVSEQTSENNQFDSLWDAIENLPIVVKLIAGLLITLLVTLLPLIIGMALSKHNIDMPNMIYVAFFFMGLGVSCGLGFLNWALFFVILLGLIIYYLVQYNQNKG